LQVERRRVSVVTKSTSDLEIEPLVVKPKVAWKLLSCGNTKGYELLQSGELESFLDGGSRKRWHPSIATSSAACSSNHLFRRKGLTTEEFTAR
jgi:hypothetical protein